MTTPQTPSDRKLLAAPPLKRRLAAGSVLLLAAGAWLAPAATPNDLARPQERAAPLLEEQIQTRESGQAARALQERVARMTARGVMLRVSRRESVRRDYQDEAPPQPAYGVIVGAEHALTHRAALDGALVAQLSLANGEAASASVAAYDPRTELVLLRLPWPTTAGAPIARVTPQAGETVVGAARGDGRDVVLPAIIGVRGDRYTVGDAMMPPGLPLFDLDGQLLAIAGPAGEALLAAPALDRLLQQRTAPASLGITYQILDNRLAEAFGTPGAAVVDVVQGGPADAAGIQPGDVLLAVGATSLAAADAPAVLASATAGVDMPVTLRRAGRQLTVTVVPEPMYEVRAREGKPGAPGTGVEARALFSAASLQASLVRRDAVVEQINGRAVNTRIQAQRLLRGLNKDAAVLVSSGGDRFFAALGRQP